MDGIYRALGFPLGYIMWVCYVITKNYGISLLLFTLLIRAALFPLSLKQQKSTVKMQMLKPQMDELQAKYKNNKEKLNEEMMKLYQKEGYNPMSGCLPMLIQFPILFGLIDVIYRPLKHILHLPADIITIGEKLAVSLGLMGPKVTEDILKGLNSSQLYVIQGVKENPANFSAMGADIIAQIQTLNLNFLGMNLGTTPQVSMFGDILRGVWNPVILIPILSGVSALLVSIISMRNTPQAGDAGAGVNASMKGMMFMMPIFSTAIAFSVPAGVGLYWFYSNLAAMLQTLALNKFYNPKEMVQKAKTELAERQERERQERIEAKKKAKASGDASENKSLSQKELNRKKLAEARKRDAEKYGEEYVDVTDDDLI